MRPSVSPNGRASVKSVLRIFFSARGTNPWVVLACLIVASLCEGIGFATLVPLLGAASGSTNQSFVCDSVRGTLHSLGLELLAGHADHRPGGRDAAQVGDLALRHAQGRLRQRRSREPDARAPDQADAGRALELPPRAPDGADRQRVQRRGRPVAAGLPARGTVRRRGGPDLRHAALGPDGLVEAGPRVDRDWCHHRRGRALPGQPGQEGRPRPNRADQGAG